MTEDPFNLDRTTDSCSISNLHEDCCDLYSPHHSVSGEVQAVIDSFNQTDGAKAVAAGCNTCAAYALDADPEVHTYVWYVAQGSGRQDGTYFGYDSDEGQTVAAKRLIDVAESLDVPYDWSGDTSYKVLIGAADEEDR
jgi:hypothetical protein